MPPLPLDSAEASTSVPTRRWARGAIVLAALGATLGTLLDHIHTRSGVTAYTRPVFAATAWWVPVLFAGAFTGGLLRPLFDRRGPAPDRRTVVLSMTLFAVAYGCSVLPFSWPVVSALLVAVFAVAFYTCDRTPIGLAIAAGSAIGGPLFEMVLVDGGTFLHTQPAYLGVSGWLPFLYLTAAVALQTTAKHLVDA